MIEIPSETSSARSPGNPRILIVGNAGQLGRELERAFTGFGTIIAVDRESVDLGDSDQIRALVRSSAPDIILNAAAYTAVDRAETDSALAHAINARAPRILAEEACLRKALFVHYSTDYVFDGSKPGPWIESDAPNPLNVYGASKLAGEQALQNTCGNHLIFRTSWIYGPHGNNFLLTLLRLARERDRLSIVTDQIGAPTSSIELARATYTIVTGCLAGRFGPPQDWCGLYHMTCTGSVSWFGFAQAIFARVAGLLDVKAPELIPVASKEYPARAVRPRNSVLSNAKLHARFGVQLRLWESTLDEVLQTLKAEGWKQPPAL
jgi:dTDP-4-dehydrorhamnose reductase